MAVDVNQFSGSGATASVVASNDTQASTGGDFSLSAVLGDGFVGLGVPVVLGDSRYGLEVNAPVPEPAVAWLLVAGMAMLLRRRRQP